MGLRWFNLKGRAARAAMGLAALGLPACGMAETAVPAKGAHPALWKLADDDTTIYLFGTIHLLPEGLKWRTPALDKAIGDSDTLVLETVLPDDPMQTAKLMMKMALSPDLPPLLERVPEDKRAALKTMIEASGIPEAALDKMETWAAAITLVAVSYKQMGFNPELGVEKGLTASYEGGDKPVKGLETVEQQFGFLDHLSEPAQRTFLASVAEDPEAARAEFEAMLKAWEAGDTDAIARTFDSETALSPELRKALIEQRNAAWADWLAKRLDQPGTILVAVGAGHLAGKDSVQKLLAEKGLKVERVQ